MCEQSLDYFKDELDGLKDDSDRILELNDVGLAHFVLRLVINDIKIIDEKNNGFIWSEIHKLWLTCTNRGIRSHIVSSKATHVFYHYKKRIASFLKRCGR